MYKYLFCLSLLSIFLGGCATHNDEIRNVKQHWQMGNTQTAELEVSEIAKDKEDSGDLLIWKLEEANIARANQNIPKSIKAFSDAHNMVSKYEAEPDIILSEETAAIFTNQSYIPYKGYNYDKIMMSIFQALNYMEIKDFDNAAVTLKTLENYQDNAQRLNQENIEAKMQNLNKAKAENSKANNNDYDVSRSVYNPSVMTKFKEVYGADFSMNSSLQVAKSLYVNPFAYWLSGIYFANKALDSADKNKASDMFRLGGEMLANKSEIFAADFKMAEDLANGKISKPENLTYVIFFTGSAPYRKQFRMDLPLYLISGEIPQVSINFPYLKEVDFYTPYLSILADSKLVKMEKIASLDEIIREEFNAELPYIITKTIISAATKAMAQYGVYKASGGDWVGLATNISMGIYQSIMNDADLRTWTSLPKEILLARMLTPKSANIIVDGQLVPLSKDGVNIVIAQKVSPNSRLLLRTFNLND